MKERSYLGSIGILIYVFTSLIDRFIYEIPDYIYIPIALFGIVLIILEFLNNKK